MCYLLGVFLSAQNVIFRSFKNEKENKKVVILKGKSCRKKRKKKKKALNAKGWKNERKSKNTRMDDEEWKTLKKQTNEPLPATTDW